MPRVQLTFWLVLVVLLVLFDQVTKWACVTYLNINEPLAILPSLNFTLAYNAGAAYGMLNDGHLWQRLFLVGLAVVICTVLVIWLKRIHPKEKCEAFAIVLILAGALGNLIDRIRLGVVVDFIDVYVGKWHWYTFNAADVFISVGAALLILGAIFAKSDKDKITNA